MTVFTGTTGDDSILGTSGGDDFHLEQGGEDSAAGGAGIDVFYFGAGFDAGDHVDGGDGNDFLVLEGDYSAGVTLTATSLANVETIQLDAGFSYSLSGFTDANLVAGKLTIDGSALAAGDDLVIDASGVASGQLSIDGGAGTNQLTGGDGDDVLDASQGALAILHGDKGDDILIGSASGADILGGGQGNDQINFGSGAVLAMGGEGDDAIGGSGVTSSSATLDGGAGDDFLAMGSVGDGASITGGDGDDLVSVFLKGETSAVIDGGAGVDTLKVGDSADASFFIRGDQFRNFEALYINTTTKVVVDDAVFAKGLTVQISVEDDFAISFDGRAEKNAAFVIHTGGENDSLIGGGGEDNMGGGKGDDLLIGNKGDDTLNAGYGSDKLVGGAGDDVLNGGNAARYSHSVDTLLGGAGDDIITIDAGVAKGGVGDDEIFGVGTSRLLGNAGDDQMSINGSGTLEGGAGDDVLSCSGNGELIGGTGQDVMTGRGEFIFQKLADSLAGSADQITDARGSTIDLSLVDADTTLDGDQAFHVVDAFSGHAGELVEAVDDFRGTSMVLGDVDGDGVADFEIDIGSTLDGTSFVL